MLFLSLAVAIPTALAAATSRGTGTENKIIFREPITVAAGALHNVHLDYRDDFQGELRVVYDHCQLVKSTPQSHTIGETHIHSQSRPKRLIWIVPKDISHNGCLHAFQGSELVGRSQPLTITHRVRRRLVISDVADAEGPWFEGVAYLESKNQSSQFVEAAKSKKIAIVGGGMSGLMTSLLLDSVGIHDWHITEASQRVGGRIRTKYLNNTSPDEYQYQEMGPMRFPVSTKYSDTNETLDIQDHKMVFQLGHVLNHMNRDCPELNVTFIPWIQSSPNTPINSNGYRLQNGLVPSAAELKANSSLRNPAAAAPNPELAVYAADQLAAFEGLTPQRLRNISRNVYQAHKQAVADGIFHWSEANYLRYQLGLDANTTDFVAGSGVEYPMWGDYYDGAYFGATTWRTIDKGLESLPRAFAPHIKDRVTFGRKIQGLTYNDDTSKISLNWRDSNDTLSLTPRSEEYDYAVVAVPFSKVRLWRTPVYSSLLTRAINTMYYDQSCKVALLYKTRFWEHLDPPIIGGCGSIDIPGIGSICYPSYQINSTRPGVILASYLSGDPCRSAASLSTSDHIALVQRAMVEAHGPVAAEQFTGVFERQLWELDEHQAGAWADPTLGQQELYLPAYYRTEWNTIFIGEHTSYTHAWIFSALDSAVRGTCQLLLALGLVDEAKQIVETWMARWIEI